MKMRRSWDEWKISEVLTMNLIPCFNINSMDMMMKTRGLIEFVDERLEKEHSSCLTNQFIV